MKKRKSQRGFSLVELLIVVAIVLVVMAIAAPNVTQAIRRYRLGAAATDVSNLLLRTRFEAIKRNDTVDCRALQQADLRWQVWIDVTQDGVPGAGEPQIILPSDATFLPPGAAPSPASMGYGVTQTPPGLISFDARGALDFGPGGVPAVYVVFLGHPNLPEVGYRAVSITPLGKAKVWRAAQGGTWTGQ